MLSDPIRGQLAILSDIHLSLLATLKHRSFLTAVQAYHYLLGSSRVIYLARCPESLSHQGKVHEPKGVSCHISDTSSQGMRAMKNPELETEDTSHIILHRVSSSSIIFFKRQVCEVKWSEETGLMRYNWQVIKHSFKMCNSHLYNRYNNHQRPIL